MHAKAWAWLGRMLYWVGGLFVFPFALNKTERVRVAMVDPTKENIVLAQSWIGQQKWGLPGGGIHTSEDAEQAAVRKVGEETGVSLSIADLQFVATQEVSEHCARYIEHIFIATVPMQGLEKQPIELLGLDWFSFDNLPKKQHSKTINLIKSQLK